MRLHLSTSLLLFATIGLPAHADQPTVAILNASGIAGGFAVHIGCGDGQLTAALHDDGRFLVQGLDSNAKDIEAARAHIHDLGLTGKVTADTFDGKTLPYADNLINLLVITDDASELSDEEIQRVLAPGGVALTLSADDQSGEPTTSFRKPWPKAIDQWTHFHHDPQGTMVGGDTTVGPPRRIQWMAGPKWLRNHDFMSSMHAMVSAGGRVFYVIDEGLRNHIFLPSQWTLIARDGFNGTVLWKRPLEDWHPHNWPLKSGPGHYPRKLVAVGDRVYVAAGLTQPVKAFDAATGELVRTYEETKPTQEILLSDGVLYLLVDPELPPIDYRAETTTYKEINRANSGWAWSDRSPPRVIAAVEAETGRVLWKHAAPVAPLTLTVGDDQVFYHSGEGLVALNRQTGEKQWNTSGPTVNQVVTGGSLRVVFSDDVVLFANGTKLTAFSAQDGNLLWKGSLMKTSHHCPEDLFVIDGLIWSVNTGKPQEKGTHFKVMNLHSGEIERDFVAKNLPGFPMHPRCYPSRATTKYIMTNGMGTEFYKVGGDTVDINNFVRGSCIYGVMPSNGLLYKPADTCACYYQSKLEHMCALAPASPDGERQTPEDRRLEKGPAYGELSLRPSSLPFATSSSWPMYRHDSTRSGSNPTPVASDLKPAWSVHLGGKLTQPVVAGGRTFVAAIDEHTLYALDAESGHVDWQYIAGGRIDSSPTLYQDLVLFGSSDGWVYALRAKDGRLAWRYQVAFGDKRIVSYEQIESAWPVSGSILVYDDVAYCLAGRNMFLDGGMRLVRLDARTGRMISESVMDENDPRTGENLQTLITKKYMPVANADLLSCNGAYVYLQAQKFNLDGKRLGIAPGERDAEGGRHLFCQTGFLDDIWYHRSYLLYGEKCGEGWGNYTDPRKSTPCGRLLVLDDSRAYGFRSEPLGNMLHPRTRYQLYAADKDPTTPTPGPATAESRRKARRSGGPKTQAAANSIGGCKVHWSIDSLPLLANAMTLGGDRLFLAGPPDLADETEMLGYLPGEDDQINRQLKAQNEAWLGKRGGILSVVSAADGQVLADYRLDSYPVFDGMSNAGGALYLSLIDGSVVKYE